MASTITYKGSTIATAQNNTKTLLTQGKYMEGNVIITDSTPPPSLQDKTVDSQYYSQTVTADSGYDGLGTVKINAMPSAVWANTPTVRPPQNITIDNPTGLVTSSIASTVAFRPIEQNGYAKTSQSFSVRTEADETKQLDTLAATTYTPTTAAQTIPKYKWLTGDQTIDPIPSQYKDMSGELAFIGVDAEWVKQIFNQSYKLEDTLYNGWTASTTAKAIVTSVTLSPVYAADLENYEYLIRWRFKFERTGTEGATLKAVPDIECQEYTQMLIKRPSSLANIEADNFNGNACITFLHAPLLLYYNASGTRTYTWAATYGFYIGMNAATFSSSTSNTPNITFKTPTINARCNSTYFATGRAAEIDQTVTSMWLTGDLYRVRKGAFVRGQYGWLVDTFNNFPE